ncbi:MAG: type II toxin-antitoxin system RelE/ParE family toxin [Rhizobium sp.]|nr:type II toxin-antitoxin system RelE/ParE family toxin [Rhizobium sp.]
MVRPPVIHPDAAAKLDRLYDYIAEQSGHARAWSYVSASRSFLNDLCVYPERGSLGMARWPGFASSDFVEA